MQPRKPLAGFPPFATGGGGHVFEQKVILFYMVLLLTEESPRGLDSATPKSIRCQARQEGFLLDDLLVTAWVNQGICKLALQIKSTLTFSSHNEEFVKTIDAAWKTWISSGEEFVAGRDRIGIAVGQLSQTVLDHCFKLPQMARTSLDAKEFISKIKGHGFSSNETRRYFAAFSDCLNRAAGRIVSEEEVWRFFSDLVLLSFDFGLEHGREVESIMYRLGHICVTPEAASKAFGILLQEAGDLDLSGGSIDALRLRKLLVREGLVKSQDASSTLLRLLEDSGFRRLAVALKKDSASGVPMPWPKYTTDFWPKWEDIESNMVVRSTLAEEIIQKLEHYNVAVVIGNPGAGKSTAGKIAAFNFSNACPGYDGILILEDFSFLGRQHLRSLILALFTTFWSSTMVLVYSW